jgi:dTDP-glucose 4,6-dehydratase
LWRELAGAQLFITGGTGFFGTWLLEAIAAANDALHVAVGATVLSRDPERFLLRLPHLAKRREFDWLRGSPASFPFPAARHDYLLHLATATSADPRHTEPIEMLHTKLASIHHVLRHARQTGVRRMLVTSSGAVYGPQPAGLGRIPETWHGAPDPLNPSSAYGEGKRLVEQVCALTPEVPCVIARCFSFIGPHLPLHGRFAAGNFLRDALNGGPIVVSGDGTARRSYMHPADLVVWLLTILLHGESCRAYNVGSDQDVSIGDLARQIAGQVGGNLSVEIRGEPDRAGVHWYVPQTDRARHELGLQLTLDLPATLRRTIGWLQAAISRSSSCIATPGLQKAAGE